MQYVSLLFIGMMIVISVRGFLSNLMKVSFIPFIIKTFAAPMFKFYTVVPILVILCSREGHDTSCSVCLIGT